MQVSGVTDNPSTVKLRYKLVAANAGRKSATSATLLPDPARAVVLFNEIEDFGHRIRGRVCDYKPGGGPNRHATPDDDC